MEYIITNIKHEKKKQFIKEILCTIRPLFYFVFCSHSQLIDSHWEEFPMNLFSLTFQISEAVIPWDLWDCPFK